MQEDFGNVRIGRECIPQSLIKTTVDWFASTDDDIESERC